MNVSPPGFILWFTGMSGAGKSTLSAALQAALHGQRRLEVLDGDEVRAHLSKGLGFTRADRDINVRRIGFVARLLARNGVAVATAAISPYADTRAEVIRQATLQRLSRDYTVTDNEPIKQFALAKADSSLVQGRWRIPAANPATDAQTLLTVNNKNGAVLNVPVAKFFTYVQQKQLPRTEPGLTGQRIMQRLYSRFVGDQLMAAEEQMVEETTIIGVEEDQIITAIVTIIIKQ